MSLPQGTIEVTVPDVPVTQVQETVTDVHGVVEEVTSGATAPIRDATEAVGLPLGG